MVTEKFQLMAIITVRTDPRTVANALAPQAHPIMVRWVSPRYLSPVGKNMPMGTPIMEINTNVVRNLNARLRLINKYTILKRKNEYNTNTRNTNIVR